MKFDFFQITVLHFGIGIKMLKWNLYLRKHSTDSVGVY